jgi:hypothetical protein
VLDVREEALARLLSVIAHIDPNVQLLPDHTLRRLLYFASERSRINLAPFAQGNEYLNEGRAARQAPGMSS